MSVGSLNVLCWPQLLHARKLILGPCLEPTTFGLPGPGGPTMGAFAIKGPSLWLASALAKEPGLRLNRGGGEYFPP